MKAILLTALIFTSHTLFATQQETVLETIMKKAEERYPDDYRMQEHYIKSEMQSLAEIIKFKAQILNFKGN